MLKIMCQVGNGLPYVSMHNNGCVWKTFTDFEKSMEVCTDGPYAQDYIVHCGAVKRRYRYNNSTKKWERVLHPRGTKRKVKPATPSAEVNKIEAAPAKSRQEKVCHFWSVVNNYWLESAFNLNDLSRAVADKRTSNPSYLAYRVTFTDGSVTYFTRDGEGKPLYETSEDPTVKKPVEPKPTPPAPVSVPWHVAYLDIVNNGAKYTCVYKSEPVFGKFELEEHEGYVKFSTSTGLWVFKFTLSAVEADYYKKETN